VLSGEPSPLLRREVWDLEVRVGVGPKLAREQGTQIWAETDLDHRPWRRVLAQHLPDRPFTVEQLADRTARKDPIEEPEATGAVQLQLGGGTPGHSPGAVRGQ